MIRALAAVPLLACLVLPGCSGEPQADYCDAVTGHQEDLSEIAASEDAGALFGALDTYDDLREEAPRDIADDWDAVIDPLRRLDEVLADHGVDASSYASDEPPADLDAEGRREIEAARSAELRASRARIVEAADAARRRIERDLHDGAQQRLVTMALDVRMARSRLEAEPDSAAAFLERLGEELSQASSELRELARGIHPAVLTDRGLDAALSALAARSAVPVELQVDLPRPLDREREAVAYFVVAEALTNIAKHAGARHASVALAQSEDALRVRIEDDGRGGARVHRDGRSTGLAGLTDRVRATGGRLEVASPEGGGTVLLAVIPLPDSAPPRSPATPARVAVPAPEEVTR